MENFREIEIIFYVFCIVVFYILSGSEVIWSSLRLRGRVSVYYKVTVIRVDCFFIRSFL